MDSKFTCSVRFSEAIETVFMLGLLYRKSGVINMYQIICNSKVKVVESQV